MQELRLDLMQLIQVRFHSEKARESYILNLNLCWSSLLLFCTL